MNEDITAMNDEDDFEDREVVFEHRILPGPSDRSYGIHVARLAGLPGAVVTRAEHLLVELEASRPVVGFQSQPPASQVQPSLFGGPAPVESEVARLDIDGMTPIEAIQKLYELRAARRPPEAASFCRMM